MAGNINIPQIKKVVFFDNAERIKEESIHQINPLHLNGSPMYKEITLFHELKCSYR